MADLEIGLSHKRFRGGGGAEGAGGVRGARGPAGGAAAARDRFFWYDPRRLFAGNPHRFACGVDR